MRDYGDENDFRPAQGHPNLSPAINAAIAQSEIEGGAHVKQLKGKGYEVTTRNTVYTLLHVGPNEWDFELTSKPRATGSWNGRTVGYLDKAPVKINLHGSTWGGSMLKTGFIGRGMHLEFGTIDPLYTGGRPTTITTSTIEDVKEI